LDIALGTVVRDGVTGFTGVAIGRVVYMNGCVQYLVKAQALHDGKPIAGEWIDEGQLEVVPDAPLFAMRTLWAGALSSGGPQPIPSALPHP